MSSGPKYAGIRPVAACAKGITAVLSSGSLLHDIQPDRFAFCSLYKLRVSLVCTCAPINLNQICRIKQT